MADQVDLVKLWAELRTLELLNQVSYVRLTMLPGVFVGPVLPRIVPEDQSLKEIEKKRLLVTADGANMNRRSPEKSSVPK